MIKILRLILLPVSLLYGLIMALRNALFALGILKSASYDVPLISVGNIAVGGTGKTPHTEYLLVCLSKKYKAAVLSRGYGRKSTGFREVTSLSVPEQCGDEPCQIKRKFPRQTVAVAESRREGIKQLMSTSAAAPDVILLDDAYQHRWVKPGLSILLMDYAQPTFADFMMPTGHLREFACGTKRADLVVLTKCPKYVSSKEKHLLKKKLRLKKYQHLFFSTYVYGAPQALFSKGEEVKLKLDSAQVLLLTGIANPKPLEEYLLAQGAEVFLLSFPDHHHFVKKDVQLLEQNFKRLAGDVRCIVTTEKDAVRLRSGLALSEDVKAALFYLPIEVKILDQNERFNQIIEDYVTKNQRSS